MNPKLQEIKELASKFLSSNTNQRKEILNKCEKIVNSLSSNDKEYYLYIDFNIRLTIFRYGNYFMGTMKKVIDKGDDFIEKEKERLNGLISNKSTTDKKKTEFSLRLNILNSFSK